MNAHDQLMLNRAAFSGDARAMDDVGLAVNAIASILGDENIKLNGHQHEGLLQALKLASDSLTVRAAFIECENLGKGDDE